MLPENIIKILLNLISGKTEYSKIIQQQVQDELLKEKDMGTERVFYALTKWTNSEMDKANLQFLLTRYFQIENKSEFDWIEMESKSLESFIGITEKCFQLGFEEAEKQRFKEFLDWIKEVPGTVAEAFNENKDLKIWISGNGREWELFILGKRDLIDKLK